MKKVIILFIGLGLALKDIQPSRAHNSPTNPVLAELNDYLMAIQIMRLDDPRAKEIFQEWQKLREASWKIRDLTDEKNLSIQDDRVMEQISQTREQQKKLLADCKKYFERKIKETPAIHFAINRSIKLRNNIPGTEVQVGHRQVVLIKIKNNRDEQAKIAMQSNRSDQILFWNKHVSIKPQSTRFTFAVLAPLEEKRLSNTLTLQDNQGNQAGAKIRLRGMPQKEKPFRLLPGESIYQVKLPEKFSSSKKPQPSFKEPISFSITDKANGKPLAARIEVKDEQGNFHWAPLKGSSYAVKRKFEGGWRTPLWEYQPGPYFYIAGNADLGVNPEGKTATIYRGFEYKPVTIRVPETGKVNVALERWINMPEQGWYSGQTHIHTTDVGIPVRFSQYWPVVSRGEDLHVSAILTLKGEWTTHAIYANEYPMGKREAFSTNDHIITYGEEFRNNPFGHLVFMGLDRLIQPISTGALGELGGPDYPPNASVLEQARAQDAITIGAHFGSYPKGDPQIKTPWPSTGYEMPIDVALGKLQLAEIYGNGGNLQVWYDLLNCGFKLPATAGPDWHIRDTPRVYVYLGDMPFTLENWRTELAKGKSFITKGPMLFFEANGQKPGHSLNFEKGPEKIHIETEALQPTGQKPVEIVYNGKVIKRTSETSTQITVDDSGWIAARCEGAHSNPVYVHFEGRPAGKAKPAENFIKIINRLEDWVEEKAIFYEEKQKQEVLEVIGEGRSVYRRIIKRAEELGRSR